MVSNKRCFFFLFWDLPRPEEGRSGCSPEAKGEDCGGARSLSQLRVNIPLGSSEWSCSRRVLRV